MTVVLFAGASNRNRVRGGELGLNGNLIHKK